MTQKPYLNFVSLLLFKLLASLQDGLLYYYQN
jgi:hypothetical protein